MAGSSAADSRSDGARNPVSCGSTATTRGPLRDKHMLFGKGYSTNFIILVITYIRRTDSGHACRHASPNSDACFLNDIKQRRSFFVAQSRLRNPLNSHYESSSVLVGPKLPIHRCPHSVIHGYVDRVAAGRFIEMPTDTSCSKTWMLRNRADLQRANAGEPRFFTRALDQIEPKHVFHLPNRSLCFSRGTTSANLNFHVVGPTH